MNDLLGAQIDLAFVGLSVALPHIKSGRLKSFGVAAARRSAV
jgi:tripartite-type tricarboxylate transporter receptor subunit TctC